MVLIGKAVGSYLVALGVDNMQPRYIDFQRTRLRYYVDFVTVKNPEYRVEDLCREDLRDYLAFLQAKEKRFAGHPKHQAQDGKLSAGYIHGCGRAVKAFASWLHQEKYTAENVLAGFTLPKIPKRQPIPLTEDEMKAVLNASLETWEWERNYAILSLMFDTGMRVEEVANLKESQIAFEKGQILDFGKGDKQRIVPFDREARFALLDYQAARCNPLEPEKDYFFLTNDGYHLEVNAIEKMFQKLRIVSKIDRLTPHLCRHTFAVRFLKNGGDLASLQRILGHESILTTQKYVNLGDEDIKDTHGKFSPMNRVSTRRRRGRKPKR